MHVQFWLIVDCTDLPTVPTCPHKIDPMYMHFVPIRLHGPVYIHCTHPYIDTLCIVRICTLCPHTYKLVLCTCILWSFVHHIWLVFCILSSYSCRVGPLYTHRIDWSFVQHYIPKKNSKVMANRKSFLHTSHIEISHVCVVHALYNCLCDVMQVCNICTYMYTAHE